MTTAQKTHLGQIFDYFNSTVHYLHLPGRADRCLICTIWLTLQGEGQKTCMIEDIAFAGLDMYDTYPAEDVITAGYDEEDLHI